MVEWLSLKGMIEVEVEDGAMMEVGEELVRSQLEVLVQDEVFRSSKRSVAFLRYVVEQTLNGSSELIKERTIGIEVFGRDPAYDTNLDHVVRTAASELRKRLAIYYGDEKHRSELRMGLVPGSYIPKFTLPASVPSSSAGNESAPVSNLVTIPSAATSSTEEPQSLPSNEVALASAAVGTGFRWRWYWLLALIAISLSAGGVLYVNLVRPSAQDLFWKPVLDTPGPVRLAVGDVPNGPPTLPGAGGGEDTPTPVLGPSSSRTVPFSDAVTIAQVVGELEARGKKVIIRRETSSSFSDLREGPVILIGAFNNEWSLRLTRQLRYSLALDADRHLIYIRDSQNSVSRTWSWATNQPKDFPPGAHSPVQHDYALISRIRNSDTGHVVVVIGGLYTYGTQAAGELLADPELMKEVARIAKLNSRFQNLQIVLGTTVTDQTPGPPKVLAVSVE